MRFPESYLDYLIYFHVVRDYFECHEVLEAHWKKDPPVQRKDHWVALIQLAVALYHHRRGNLKGASLMYRRAEQKIVNEVEALTSLAIDVSELLKKMKQLQTRLDKNEAFVDIDIPLTSSNLLQQCEKRCLQLLGKPWQINASPDDDDIVHKHKRRRRHAHE